MAKLLSLSILFVSAILPKAVVAQTEFEVTAFRKSSSNFYEIVVQGTRKDQEIVCALKNAAGDIIATDTKYGDALATNVLIRYQGDDVIDAICVPNE
ncbi:MAG: hypothetical protein K9G43_05295 [Rhodobacteraceae bacterium]|nr:hypothetical protein [Paracoccaceae bacterium]